MLALLFSASFVRTAGAGASQENDLSLRPPYDLLPPTFRSNTAIAVRQPLEC
jgi:hypothetical protein